MAPCFLVTLIIVLAWASAVASQAQVVKRYNYGVVVTHEGHGSPKTTFWPPMKFFNHSFEDNLATSHALSYQLEQVVNASKAAERIFRSMVDPLLSGDLAVPEDFFLTMPGYIAIATAGVTCLNFLMFLWLAYRLRLTTAAVAALISPAPTALARTLPSLLIVSYPPTTSFPSLSRLDFTIPPWIFGYLVLFLILFYIGKQLWRCRQRSAPLVTEFTLFLEVSAHNRCMAFKLQTAAGCPADYVPAGNVLCNQVAITGILNPQLSIEWGDFQLVNRHTTKVLVLATTCRLTWIERIQLSSLLRKPYVCLLFFTHGRQSFYVSL